MTNNTKSSRFNSVLWGLMLSYIIILVIPVSLISTFSYNKYNSVLEEKVGNSVNVMLTHAKDVLDNQIEEVRHLPIKLTKNLGLVSVINSNDIKNINSYKVYECVNLLNSYKILNDFIYELAIYIESADVVITTQNMTNISTFTNHLYRYSDMEEADFRLKMANVSTFEVWPVHSLYKGKDNFTTPVLTCAQSISFGAEPSFDVKLLALIKGDVVHELMEEALSGYEGNVYIFNKNGDKILHVSTNKQVFDDYFIYDMLKNEHAPVERIEFNENEFLVFQVESIESGWYYAAIIPSVNVFYEISSIRKLIVAVTICILLVGIFGAIWFAYGHYRPINKLLGLLSTSGKQLKSFSFKRQNEWHTIERQIKINIDSKKNLEQYVKDQYPVIKANIFCELFKGRLGDEQSIISALTSLNIEMSQFHAFSVLTFSLDGYQYVNSTDAKKYGDILYLRYSIGSIIEDMCKAVGVGYHTNIDDEKTAVLVGFTCSEPEKNYNDIRKIAQEAVTLFAMQYDFTVTVGLGSIYKTLSEVKKSYYEALTALDYKIIKGNNTMIDYREITLTPGYMNFYSIDEEKNLVDCLKRADLDSIEQILGTIVNKMQKNLPSIETARCVYFEIISTALRVIDVLGISEIRNKFSETQIKSLLNSETIEQLYSEVIKFYSSICDMLDERKESKNYQLAEDVIKYIDQNLCDSNLSLTMVADSFNISPSYLSRFFKDQFGYNFSEYLHKQRIEKSKELLKDSRLTINCIAQGVGYGNVQSYINMFKKLEGLTPGKFRENGLL